MADYFTQAMREQYRKLQTQLRRLEGKRLLLDGQIAEVREKLKAISEKIDTEGGE